MGDWLNAAFASQRLEDRSAGEAIICARIEAMKYEDLLEDLNLHGPEESNARA